MQKTKLGRIIERGLIALALAVIIGTTVGGVSGMIAADSSSTTIQDAR